MTERIIARDGYELAASVFLPENDSGRTVVVSSATAVPRGFYRRFAQHLAAAGQTVVTYDYRGIGDSRPESLRGFHAETRDWAMLDMASVFDWADSRFGADRLFVVGHSVGGQLAGLVDNADLIDGMVTASAQSGYWRLQGGGQKMAVALHAHLTLPALSKMFGYMPWSRFGDAEDLPKGVALEWSRWVRDPEYVLGDHSLPLQRYEDFTAPVLAFSVDDDKWGTRRSVDVMMAAYPNVERRHVTPADLGIDRMGHFGFFRTAASPLWDQVIEWLDAN